MTVVTAVMTAVTVVTEATWDIAEKSPLQKLIQSESNQVCPFCAFKNNIQQYNMFWLYHENLNRSSLS